MIYGYVRKEYPKETTQQIQQLMQYKCEKLFIEENDLYKVEELQKLLKVMQKDDQIVVVDLLVFGQKLKTLKWIMRELLIKEIRFISLENNLDTKKDRTFYEMVFLMAQMDQSQTIYQAKKRTAHAKKIGRSGGRPSIGEDQIEVIEDLYTNKKLSMRKIADHCDLSIGTVRKYIKQIT